MVATAPKCGNVAANSKPSKTLLDIVGVAFCLLFVLLATAAASAVATTLVRMAWAVFRAYAAGN